MAAPDLSGLVPMEPPEGLLGWALGHDPAGHLERGALVYEVEYRTRHSVADVLDESAPPRKEKMVRVTCTTCGASMLCQWTRDIRRKSGYGFINVDEHGDMTETVFDGDEARCPICGEPVTAYRAAGIGKKGKVLGEMSVMSAGLIGPENWLALTVWTVQRKIYRGTNDRYKIIPAEAYVFGPDFEATLLAWRNSYGGTAGYFISYAEQWRQTNSYVEPRYLEEVYGLTDSLVEASCLPNCKLDVYMRSRPGSVHFPVEYLRLYRRHPNVEAVLLHGLPRVLDGIIRTTIGHNAAWEDCGIDWRETKPAKMLGLTREELRLGQAQCWGKWQWDLFTRAKQHGERLTAEDMIAAFELGDDGLLYIPGHGPVAKAIRYLRRQIEETAVDIDNAGADPIPDAGMLLDYWNMSRRLGRGLDEPLVRWPQDLIAAHDELAAQADRLEDKDLIGQFRQRRRELRHLRFAAEGLLIRPAATQHELIAEGDALHHCVRTYAKRYAGGETAIFFIRRVSAPDKSFYTLELNERSLIVVQNRGLRNCARTPEVLAFEEKWIAWVRAGAPRDRDGRPVVKAERKRSAA